jgi:hypothetical protein
VERAHRYIADKPPREPERPSLQDAKNCADTIKDYDSIFHRYGLCDHDDCTVCDAEDEEKHRNGECADNCTVCRWEHEANTQHVADLA